jgi:hypothetical protein
MILNYTFTIALGLKIHVIKPHVVSEIQISICIITCNSNYSGGMMVKQKLVLIGNGMAGVRCIEEILKNKSKWV